MRSLRSRNLWLTLFTLTRTAQPSCSARACAYPVIEKHSIFFVGTVVVWLIRNLMRHSNPPVRPVPAPACRRPQTANRAAGQTFRRGQAVPCAFRFPGVVRLPEREFCPLGES